LTEQEDSRAGESGAQAGGSSATGSRGDEAERTRRLEEEIRRLPVRDHLFLMMHSLSDLAAIRLGLVGESDAGRDLEQARLAIEGYRALLGVLETAGSSQEIGPRRALLAQLQLAYAAAVKAEASESTRSETPAAEPGNQPTDS